MLQQLERKRRRRRRRRRSSVVSCRFSLFCLASLFFLALLVLFPCPCPFLSCCALLLLFPARCSALFFSARFARSPLVAPPLPSLSWSSTTSDSDLFRLRSLSISLRSWSFHRVRSASPLSPADFTGVLPRSHPPRQKRRRRRSVCIRKGKGRAESRAVCRGRQRLNPPTPPPSSSSPR